MRWGWWLIVAAAVGLVFPSQWMRLRSAGRIRTVRTVATSEVALVLGAGVRRDGRPSRILHGRLRVARELYRAGRVRQLLVSGSPRSRGHSEPRVMRDYLINAGVPAGDVLLDESGVDTWRSCLAARNRFHLERLTVVTTKFHLRRAIWLCRRLGIEAQGVGHDARVDGLPLVNARCCCREVLATAKAFWRPRRRIPG